jgi:voltage-gated potassium channel
MAGSYRVQPQYPRLKTAIALIIGEMIIGTIGYIILEDTSLLDALYMTVITISTVGYGEVTTLSEAGKIFSIGLIITNFLVFAYGLYVVTYYIFEGKIYIRMHREFINKKIAKLHNHVILVGYGRYGKEASEHFLGLKEPFVVIDKDDEIIQDLQENEKEVLYIQGDATHDDALELAGIQHAKAIIIALPDDTDNVFTVLSARQIRPDIQIISRAHNKKTRKKLELAGADHVILPDQIGGFYMATLVSKPSAVDFFSFIATEYEKDMGLQEIAFENTPSQWRGKSIAEVDIRKMTGVNIIGLKTAGNQFVINPGPDSILKENESFIVLGDTPQLALLKKALDPHE